LWCRFCAQSRFIVEARPRSASAVVVIARLWCSWSSTRRRLRVSIRGVNMKKAIMGPADPFESS